MLCTMNNIDHQGDDEFICEAYISKFEVNANENEEKSDNDSGYDSEYRRSTFLCAEAHT